MTNYYIDSVSMVRDESGVLFSCASYGIPTTPCYSLDKKSLIYNTP